MVQWAEKLYIGDKLKKKKDQVIASINKREATFNVYCIAFASQPCNLFDIMDANEHLFPHYKKVDVRIVGLARGKKEAITLVQQMIMEVYRETGAFDVRAYFT